MHEIETNIFEEYLSVLNYVIEKTDGDLDKMSHDDKIVIKVIMTEFKNIVDSLKEIPEKVYDVYHIIETWSELDLDAPQWFGQDKVSSKLLN